MNFRLIPGLAAIVCMSLVSCYPYNENAQKKKATKGAEKTVSKADELKAKEEAELKKKKEEEELKKKEAAAGGATAENPAGNAENPDGQKPGGETKTETKRTDYPVASKVPGKEGYVFSPYNNKIISVRDEQDRLIPSGTLVQDPTYQLSEKKYFRVP